jgi:hypothetical protein
VAWLIIHLIIQTIRQDPSGSVWIDEASDVSRPDPSGAHQSVVEHQTTDLAVGGSNLSRRASKTAGQRPCDRVTTCYRGCGLRPNCDHVGGQSRGDCDHLPPRTPIPAQ